MADLIHDLERIKAERQDAARYLDEHSKRISHWREHKERIRDVTNMAKGDWHLVFPDGQSQVEKPKVPNVIQLKLNDASGLASTVQGSIRCDPASGNERAKPKAEKRERICEYYRRCNNSHLMSARFFQDLMIAGVNYRVVLPDFSKREPWIRRIDPRWAYPDTLYSPDREIRNFLVSYQESRSALAAEHQGIDKPRQGESDLVDVLEWYDGSEFLRVAAIPDGRSKRGVVLARMENLLSRVPVVISSYPSFDGEFRGIFDQVIGVLEAENRILNLLLDATADMVSSPIIEYDIENPEDYGTGAILHAKSEKARWQRGQPEGPSGALFAILNEARGSSRIGAVYPEARQGEVQQAIASAAFVSAITGNLSTEIAHFQRLEGDAMANALSLALEIDEKYLDDGELKYITGSANAKRFSESYRPSVDIRGDYQVRVEYGGAAGGDQQAHIIRLVQQYINGLIDEETVMEALPDVKDVQETRKRIVKDQILKAGLAFVAAKAADPNGPDFAPAAALIEALDKGDETVFTVLARFRDIQNPTPPQQATTGAEAFTQASSLSRGGISPQTNVPGVGSLPDLAELGLGA